MPDDFDIPDIPDVDGSGNGSDGGSAGGDGSGRGGAGGGRRWPWLAAGLVLGIAGTLVLPGLVGPRLPDALRSDRLRIRGEVLKKRADAEHVQLTVETDSGAMLATFRRRISALDLLVEPGDSITVVLDRYRPFVEDPGLRGVRKGRSPAAGPGRTEGAGPEAVPPADSAPSGTEGAAGGGVADTAAAADTAGGA